jgi:hypothetical protein
MMNQTKHLIDKLIGNLLNLIKYPISRLNSYAQIIYSNLTVSTKHLQKVFFITRIKQEVLSSKGVKRSSI